MAKFDQPCPKQKFSGQKGKKLVKKREEYFCTDKR